MQEVKWQVLFYLLSNQLHHTLRQTKAKHKIHYLEDLENIIKFVDQLENANTQNIEPLASPLEKTAKTRNDEVTAKNRKETFLERSPKSNDDYFLVPRVVE